MRLPVTRARWLVPTHPPHTRTRAQHYLDNDLKLRKFVPIIKDSLVYPVIYDANRTVLSLPPIINGAHSAVRTLCVRALAPTLPLCCPPLSTAPTQQCVPCVGALALTLPLCCPPSSIVLTQQCVPCVCARSLSHSLSVSLTRTHMLSLATLADIAAARRHARAEGMCMLRACVC